MSRRTWSTEDGWEVAVGWDAAPRSHFFMDIGCECSCSTVDENEECPLCHGSGTKYLFNNLDVPEYPMGEMTLGQVALKLQEYLTDTPPGIYTILLRDMQDQVMNVNKDYGVIGVTKRG